MPTRAQELHTRKTAHDKTKRENRKPDARKKAKVEGKGKSKGTPR